MNTLSKLLLGSVAALTLAAGLAPVAEAGRGSSSAEIDRAIRTNHPDAIIGELERAEYLWCGGCIDSVRGLLDHPEYAVREVAAWWFARRPYHKDQLSAESIATLESGDSIAVRNAADVLGTFRHPRAIPALSAVVTRMDLDPEARMASVRALGTIGHPAANPALAAAMGDPSAVVRATAVRAWFQIRGQSLATPVVPLLADTDTVVRRESAAVVGQFRDAEGRAALEDLVLNDPDPAVRRNAAWALGEIGDSASYDVLTQAMDDPSPLVRGTARVARGQLR